MPQQKRIAIIGAGIAGLCAAGYAKRAGYDVDVYEMGSVPGGLAINWKRGDYTFETCIHWLLGSNPGSEFRSWWRELFDIDEIKFHDPEEYSSIESENGASLTIYRDVERMERELLSKAPEDEIEIRNLANAIRRFSRIDLPANFELNFQNIVKMAKLLPHLREMSRWSQITLAQYGKRYENPLLRKFFGESSISELSAIAIVFSLVWMNQKDGGYPIGGSTSFILPIAERLVALGGRIHYKAKVKSILVKDDRAIGLELSDGKRVYADWIISAADGHATIYEMLAGRYLDKKLDAIYRDFKAFPSYIQVSFGIKDDGAGLLNRLKAQPEYLTLILNSPMDIDPETRCAQLSLRFFHFDPTFAPEGKLTVTCFIATENFEYWTSLRTNDPNFYRSEKSRIASAVLQKLESRLPGISTQVEETDISSPATVIRYTGNWRGSMEGWLLTPKTGPKPLSMKLPGLQGFRMIGQWIAPGGGIPSGLMTGRAVVRELTKRDGIAWPS